MDVMLVKGRDWKPCAGYQQPCAAMIPPGKASHLCFFCERTQRHAV